MFSFVETRLFTKLVLEYLSDAEYAALQGALIADPDAGDVVQGPVESGSFDGRLQVAASAAATG